MIEFTGERVIPGEVHDDLWAEHAARYAFARRYAAGGRALDVGCGAGYGLAGIAPQVEYSLGIDPSAEAIAYAHAHYANAKTRFLQAPAEALPFADHVFHLVTAFEVIEHIAAWPDLVREARRVTDPSGVFVVSTPNKLYYAESRAEQGPNPFHAHEFEFAEFRDAMQRAFPYVVIFLQNRGESFTFAPVGQASLCCDAHLENGATPAEHANFFIAVCSLQPPSEPRPFVYVPSAANLLREREHHIHLLQQELLQTKQWLDDVLSKHQTLQDLHVEQTRHLQEQNRWALDLESRWQAAMNRVTALQAELQTEQAAAADVVAQYNRKIAELEEENRAKTQWALDTEARLTAELAARSAELAEAVRLLDRAEATVVERTTWARDLQQRVEHLQAQLAMVRQSRWVKLGRVAGLGPQVKE